MVAPAVEATIQASVLSVTSSILAQVVEAYRSDKTFSLNLIPLGRMLLVAILNTAPNFLFQQFLEETFPAYTIKPAVLPSEISSEKKGGVATTKNELLPEKKLSIRNTVIKLLIDQTIGAPINNALFIAEIAAMNGASGPQVLQKVKTDTLPLLFASYKVWPLVALLSFTVVPFEWRVIFGGTVGIAWGIFLNLFVNT